MKALADLEDLLLKHLEDANSFAAGLSPVLAALRLALVSLRAEANAERQEAEALRKANQALADEVLGLRRQLALTKGMRDLDPL